MANKTYSVKLSEMVRQLELTVEYEAPSYADTVVDTWDVSRPGLPLAGFYEYFSPERVQIIGKLEVKYLSQMPSVTRRFSVDRYMSSGIRFLIVAHGMRVPGEMRAAAEQYGVTLLTTEMSTSAFMAKMIFTLNSDIAPRTTLHGVLMEIHGEGVLITGESGVGKSESALALLSRGHRLVADDAIDVKLISGNTLVGTAPELIRYFMEVRGIGLVDVRTMYGVGSVKLEQDIDMVVHFEPWDTSKIYDRLGNEPMYTDILGIKIPLYVIPVRPGRSLSDILELAAMTNRGMKMGYNAAQTLVERHDKLVDEG